MNNIRVNYEGSLFLYRDQKKLLLPQNPYRIVFDDDKPNSSWSNGKLSHHTPDLWTQTAALAVDILQSKTGKNDDLNPKMSNQKLSEDDGCEPEGLSYSFWRDYTFFLERQNVLHV